jgi:hypothetical protein
MLSSSCPESANRHSESARSPPGVLPKLLPCGNTGAQGTASEGTVLRDGRRHFSSARATPAGDLRKVCLYQPHVCDGTKRELCTSPAGRCIAYLRLADSLQPVAASECLLADSCWAPRRSRTLDVHWSTSGRCGHSAMRNRKTAAVIRRIARRTPVLAAGQPRLTRHQPLTGSAHYRYFWQRASFGLVTTRSRVSFEVSNPQGFG